MCVRSERHFLILNIYMNCLSCVDENFCWGTKGIREEGWPWQTAQLVLSLCLAPAFAHGSDDNWYMVWIRRDMLIHSLQGAYAHANKATPAVPALCLDSFLSDATIVCCYNPNPTVSTLCPRSVDQTWLYSGLSNEILISAPLLLQCVLKKKKKKNQYSARQRSSCRQ